MHVYINYDEFGWWIICYFCFVWLKAFIIEVCIVATGKTLSVQKRYSEFEMLHKQVCHFKLKKSEKLLFEYWNVFCATWVIYLFLFAFQTLKQKVKKYILIWSNHNKFIYLNIKLNDSIKKLSSQTIFYDFW